VAPVQAISSVKPSDGKTDVPRGDAIEVVFSEDMDEAPSKVPGSFTRTKQGSASPVVGRPPSYDSATKLATLKPSQDLDSLSSYVAVLKSGADGVKTLDGNPLTANKTWSFNTEQ